MYHANARGYDPVLGRFMQIDPLADQFPGWTPYHYTHNNPINMIDPTGMAYCGSNYVTYCGDDGEIYATQGAAATADLKWILNKISKSNHEVNNVSKPLKINIHDSEPQRIIDHTIGYLSYLLNENEFLANFDDIFDFKNYQGNRKGPNAGAAFAEKSYEGWLMIDQQYLDLQINFGFTLNRVNREGYLVAELSSYIENHDVDASRYRYQFPSPSIKNGYSTFRLMTSSKFLDNRIQLTFIRHYLEEKKKRVKRNNPWWDND